jgi:hypothetical protein
MSSICSGLFSGLILINSKIDFFRVGLSLMLFNPGFYINAKDAKNIGVEP